MGYYPRRYSRYRRRYRSKYRYKRRNYSRLRYNKSTSVHRAIQKLQQLTGSKRSKPFYSQLYQAAKTAGIALATQAVTKHIRRANPVLPFYENQEGVLNWAADQLD